MSTTSATDPVVRVPEPPIVPSVTRVDEARVASFIAAHKLEGYVEAAVRLARDAFPHAKRFTLSVFGDPDERGESLDLDVATGAGVDESLRQSRDFIQRWAEAAPPWVTDLLGISIDLR